MKSSVCRRPLSASALLLSVALSTGCVPAVPMLATVERRPPGDLVSPCRPQPVPAADLRSDSELSLYLIDLANAGEDCRQKHAALARWSTGEAP